MRAHARHPFVGLLLGVVSIANVVAGPDFTASTKCIDTPTGCVAPGAIEPGEVILFRLQIANLGDETATDVFITDDKILGPSCWLSEITAATCGGAPPCVTCWVSVLTPGADFEANTANMQPGCVLDIEIRATVNPLSTGLCCNDALVEWSGPAPGGTYTTDAACFHLIGECSAAAGLAASTTTACLDEEVTLDASGSTLDVCSGTATYTWFRDAVPLPDTASSIAVSESAAGSYVYSVDVTCSTDPTCTASASETIEVDPGFCLPCEATATMSGPDAGCTGVPIVLDASASTVVDCPAPGTITYLWLRDGLPVPPPEGEAPAYTADESDEGIHVYTVQVGCSTDSSCLASDARVIDFRPDGTPVRVGNELRAVRLARDVELEWADPQPLAESWTLYRSISKLDAGLPLLAADVWYTDVSAVDEPPDRYFYNVVAVSCGGIEGPF